MDTTNETQSENTFREHWAGMSWTGLAALVWDPSGGDDPQADHDYIRRLIEQNPGPALDVGCGTGRLLLRYMAAGLDVDGIDTSGDMLAICRQKAEAQGLNPNLYEQALQALDLPRKYRVIFIPCGTLCLIIDRDAAQEALHRCYEALEAGGLLVFNLFWPRSENEALSDVTRGPDGEWNPMWTNTLPDGRQIAQHYKRIRVDRVEQVMYAERRYRLIENDEVIAEEIFNANERWYFKHEMQLMLEKAGFQDIRISGNWTDEPFDESEHYSIIYTAHKA
jgi:SAM-dependent methyltransferase